MMDPGIVLRMAAQHGTKEDDRAILIFTGVILAILLVPLFIGWLLGRVTFTW